ncbi:MAG: acyl-CoA dehydrogenase family protein [Steroidobacteraceae bacterium]|jgi:alkylation response protein AidB-like acyl-CoA dehydrogenase
MNEIEEFRRETRQWLETHCPASMRTPMSEREVVWGGRNGSFPSADAEQWLRVMAERGWTAPSWPTQYGGGGLSAQQSSVLQEELRRLKARPPLYSFGLWMFGPVLLEFGDEQQKQRFLPPIVRGEIRWCQGYSEPGAGSDLASLATRCEDRGDHFLINGQKIWTSYANLADWMFCLVRTDTGKKHGGISFIVFDMRTAGVETRPIRLISGESPFCETFLTDVRVPKDQLIGPLNGGWDIAKRLLMHERTNISAEAFGNSAGLDLLEAARQFVGLRDGVLIDTDLRARIARHRMRDDAFRLAVQQARTTGMRSGSAASATLASTFKVAAASLNQQRCELLIECLGHDGLGWEGDGFVADGLRATRHWLRSKGNSIEGGTTEINLNVIAKRALGLPDAT